MLERLKLHFYPLSQQFAEAAGVSAVWLKEYSDTFYVMGRYDYGRDEVKIAQFRLRQLYGCSGIVVSYAVKVSDEYQGRGLGKLLHTVRIAAAKDAGYTVMQCTSRADNDPQNSILRRNGWKEVYRFRNSKTGNMVIVWLKSLN